MPVTGQMKRAQRNRERAAQQKREADSQPGASKEVGPAPEPEAIKKQKSENFNNNKKDKLRYPIRDQDLYGGQVRFRVKELAPLTGSQLANLDFVDELFSAESVSKLDDKIGKTGETTSEGKKQRAEVVNKESERLKGKNNKTYENPGAQSKYAGSVTLYLPQQLQIQDAVTYSNGASLGAIGAGVEAGLANGASALDAIGAGLTQGIDSFTNLFGNAGLDAEASALALTRTAQTLGTQEIANGVRAATRVAVNPNLRSLLESVPIRTVPFNFRLVAQNRREAQEIEKIVKFFRYQMYPDEIEGQIGGANVSLGYKFPDPFEITTTYKGKQVGTKFLDAYLQSVSVTYNEQGAGFHSDGYPTDVSVALTFIESKALTRRLVEEGY